jgi:hypothetical protein
MFTVCITYYDEVNEFGGYMQKVWEFEKLEDAQAFYNAKRSLYKDNGLIGITADC